MFKSTGKCVIFSAPSGAGKTTIVHHLLKHNSKLKFSVSACSREPRRNEVDGRDYHFIGVKEFKKRIQNDEFVEWEEVYTNNYYGTLKSEINRIWDEDKVVIFDVDVIGGLNLKRIFGDAALAIFVQPPSYDELEHRLRSRSTEAEDKIIQRLGKAKEELKYAPEFDEILINDDLSVACNQAEELVSQFIKS